MIQINNFKDIDFDTLPVDTFWNLGEEKEHRMHKIHVYPARFPAFITTKALEFARQNSIRTNSVADIFCGCGTVAYEVRRCNIAFWGCDINPVATMIARVKSRKYQTSRLKKYYATILTSHEKSSVNQTCYDKANPRLRYWYDREHYENLFRLKTSIEKSTPASSYYRLFFICAFSNILKKTSRWLSRSIKPQVDPEKLPADALIAFKHQVDFMILANTENDISNKSEVRIVTKNLLKSSSKRSKVDMIVTSPPYVTSYEYADLHQLSSLWLGYAEDFRELRKGSIGSLYNTFDFEKTLKSLNNTGSKIVKELLSKGKSKAYAAAKYFSDMQQVAKVCYSMLNMGGGRAFRHR